MSATIKSNPGPVEAEFDQYEHSRRVWFVEWFDKLVTRAIPDNFEEFTVRQLRDYAFDVLFDGLDNEKIAPADDSLGPLSDPLDEARLAGFQDCENLVVAWLERRAAAANGAPYRRYALESAALAIRLGQHRTHEGQE